MTIKEGSTIATSAGDLALDILRRQLSATDLCIHIDSGTALDRRLTDALATSGVSMAEALEAALPLAARANDSFDAAQKHAVAAEKLAKCGRLYLAASLLIRAMEEAVIDRNDAAAKSVYEASKLVWG